MYVISEINDIDRLYQRAVNLVKERGAKIDNTKEISPITLTLDENKSINIISIRDISLSYLIGELLWYLQAKQDVHFISKFSEYWRTISDNNITSNSAYGHIVHMRYGYDQLESVLNILKKDKNSRRALINFSVPNIDRRITKDEICTIAIQFLVRDDKLNCHVYMRSCDLYTGFPYDYIYFTCLQHIVAEELSLEVGSYYHTCTSLHFYDKNEDDMKRIGTYDLSKNRERYALNLPVMTAECDALTSFVEETTTDRKTMHKVLVDMCKTMKILEVKDE